jgi:hypothetical protein
MPIIPALGRQRQKDSEFQTSLDNPARHCLKQSKEGKNTKKELKPFPDDSFLKCSTLFFCCLKQGLLILLRLAWTMPLCRPH